MTDQLTDEELWSLADRRDPALDGHLQRHPEDQSRVDALRAALGAVASANARSRTPWPDRIGSYVVTGLLGQGGMGVVYEAWQEKPRRKVALKVLRDASLADERAVQRFERETEVLGRLSHPSIAAVYEAGRTEAGEPFIAMELVRGRTLAEHAQAHRLDRRARIELVLAVCDGVHHAHRQGVVHRDLKPSNIVVDAESGPKVLDFGLARLRGGEPSAQLTVAGAGGVIGTLAYMSPEQARGDIERVDERSDVYSIGVMLYQLLTGALPHAPSERSVLDTVRAICDERPKSLRAHDRSLRGDLETVVSTALEKDPDRRYQSAAALGEDLRNYLAGRPILARKPSVGYRAWKLALRHKLSASLLAVAILFAGVSLYSAAFRGQVFHLSGSWWMDAKAPFDGLRWEGRTPHVRLDERWYELVEIDGRRVEYILGFCVQEERDRWRKRFSEDLVQVLNLMGDWCIWDVDLLLRDPASGALLRRDDVPLTTQNRRAIWTDRYRWPFSIVMREDGRHVVHFQERRWEFVSLEGYPAAKLLAAGHARLLSFLYPDFYDGLCELSSRSPGRLIRFELRDLETDEMHAFEDFDRFAPPGGEAR